MFLHSSVVCLLSALCVMSSEFKSSPHLRDVVVGRCWEYQMLQFSSIEKNCWSLWDLFYKAFSCKDPCDTTSSDYAPFLDEIGMQEVKPNKSLFWSGTYKLAHTLSDFGARFMTLEDTMAGWMLNNLWWCGSTKNCSSGINYTYCPQPAPNCDYISAFWGEASKKFAEAARGIVHLILNGSRFGRPAYSRESFFGKQELPNLQVDHITELVVSVVGKIDGPHLETCANGSIKLLQEDVRSRGIKTKCYDNPDNVRHLLCTDHPNSRGCLFLNEGTKGRNEPMIHHTTEADRTGPWNVAAIRLSLFVSLCLAVVVSLVIHHQWKKMKTLRLFNYELLFLGLLSIYIFMLWFLLIAYS